MKKKPIKCQISDYFPRFSCRSLSVEGGDGVQLFVETYIGFWTEELRTEEMPKSYNKEYEKALLTRCIIIVLFLDLKHL